MSIDKTQDDFRKALREFLATWKVQLTPCTDDGVLSIEAIMRTGDNEAVQFELTTGDTIGAPLVGYSFGFHDDMLFICDEHFLHTGSSFVGAYFDRNGVPQRILRESMYGEQLARFSYQRFNLDIGPVLGYIIGGLMDILSGATGAVLVLDEFNIRYQKDATERLLLTRLESIASVKDPAFIAGIDLLAGVRGGYVTRVSFSHLELADHIKSEILPMLEP